MHTLQLLIEELAIPHRATDAFWRLMRLGAPAIPAMREGLRHAHADVRLHSTRFFDHHFVPDALDDLIACLDDPDPRVRLNALHSLGCDRCKDICRPGRARILPRALAILASDPDAHVRAMAAEFAGKAVHEHDWVAPALDVARTSDPSPTVRKVAGWYAPGGTIFKRLAPRSRRQVPGQR